MADKGQRDISKWKVAIIGIGFVIGLAMLVLGGADSDRQEKQEDELESYKNAVESKLENICEAMIGGDAEVFVSYEEGFSYSYALDSRGGVVTVGSGSSEKALVSSVAMPKISGVGIVCGGSRYDESKLLELVSSSLGIGKNKIFR